MLQTNMTFVCNQELNNSFASTIFTLPGAQYHSIYTISSSLHIMNFSTVLGYRLCLIQFLGLHSITGLTSLFTFALKHASLLLDQ